MLRLMKKRPAIAADTSSNKRLRNQAGSYIIYVARLV